VVLLGYVLTLVAVGRALRAVYVDAPTEEPRPGAGVRPTEWSAGGFTAGILMAAYVLFANPIHGLAVQGAEALGLR